MPQPITPAQRAMGTQTVTTAGDAVQNADGGRQTMQRGIGFEDGHERVRGQGRPHAKPVNLEALSEAEATRVGHYARALVGDLQNHVEVVHEALRDLGNIGRTLWYAAKFDAREGGLALDPTQIARAQDALETLSALTRQHYGHVVEASSHVGVAMEKFGFMFDDPFRLKPTLEEVERRLPAAPTTLEELIGTFGTARMALAERGKDLTTFRAKLTTLVEWHDQVSTTLNDAVGDPRQRAGAGDWVRRFCDRITRFG